MGLMIMTKIVEIIIKEIFKYIKPKKESYNSMLTRVTLITKKYKIKFEIEKITTCNSYK